MSERVITLLSPFVKRGLFDSPEKAVMTLARDYTLHQIEHYQSEIEQLQKKYGMNYEQFEVYLAARSATLAKSPSPGLSQMVMAEEEDALEWKIARDMLTRWLGLQAEVAG
jgi:hypothetical protein